VPRRQAGAGVVPVRTVLIGRPNCVAKSFASQSAPRHIVNTSMSDGRMSWTILIKCRVQGPP
jgi:hypothetical protein